MALIWPVLFEIKVSIAARTGVLAREKPPMAGKTGQTLRAERILAPFLDNSPEMARHSASNSP